MNQPNYIAIGDIVANADQPRQTFVDDSLAELAASIKEHGVIQPLVVCENTAEATAHYPYRLIAGERRLRAAQIAGLTEVPCIVRNVIPDAQTELELALIENIQREDLSPADEARAYQRLHDEFKLTDEQIAQRVGKSRSDITTTRNLAKLPAAVSERIGDGDGQLPKRTVRLLLPLANAVEPDRLIKITNEIAALKPGEDETPEDVIYEALEQDCYKLPVKDSGWDLAWPGKPIEVSDEQGVFAVVACKGCPSAVHAQSGWRKGDFCTNARCFEAKTALFDKKELERLAKKFSLPVAVADGKTIHTLQLNYNTSARARKWLLDPPDHLRLAPFSSAVNLTNAYEHRSLLGSPVVVLASTLKDPFASKDAAVPARSAGGKAQPETDAQRAKRIAAEEREARAKRAERGAVRRARADVAWLALNVVKLVAPQIGISGPALDFVAWFVDDRARGNGNWPAVYQAMRTNEEALETAKGKERESLLRERIILKLLYEKVPQYSNDWELHWDDVVYAINELITTRASDEEEVALGLKLPAGWDKPPIHTTPSNCWHCGRFTPNAEMTQVDRADGWGTSSHGSGKDGMTLDDVYCPECGQELRDKVKAEDMRARKAIMKNEDEARARALRSVDRAKDALKAPEKATAKQ